jgi:hypothetical protein
MNKSLPGDTWLWRISKKIFNKPVDKMFNIKSFNTKKSTKTTLPSCGKSQSFS